MIFTVLLVKRRAVLSKTSASYGSNVWSVSLAQQLLVKYFNNVGYFIWGQPALGPNNYMVNDIIIL